MTTTMMSQSDLKEPSRVDQQLIYSTHQLFSGTSEVLLNHQGVVYRLRITRQDKLLLTK